MKFDQSSRKPSAVAFVWLLAAMQFFLPIGLHAAAGIILCIAGDGTFEIESGRFGDCASNAIVAAELHDEHAVEAPTLLRSCPDSCIDVLIFSSSADGQASVVKRKAPISDPASWGSTAPYATIARTDARAMPLGSAFRISQFPKQIHRSVVLLI